MGWSQVQAMPPRRYTCGFCGNLVSSERGWNPDRPSNRNIYVCPHCDKPSYFHDANQIPGVAPGADVKHLPNEIEKLYEEARRTVAIGANTASVLAARKLLMHIAVSQGARENDSFLAYVTYLAEKGFVPPNGRGWVDHIRAKGNEANHEIKLMTSEDASELVDFVEMLLKFIYEFPNRVPKPKS